MNGSILATTGKAITSDKELLTQVFINYELIKKYDSHKRYKPGKTLSSWSLHSNGKDK